MCRRDGRSHGLEPSAKDPGGIKGWRRLGGGEKGKKFIPIALYSGKAITILFLEALGLEPGLGGRVPVRLYDSLAVSPWRKGIHRLDLKFLICEMESSPWLSCLTLPLGHVYILRGPASLPGVPWVSAWLLPGPGLMASQAADTLIIIIACW